MADSKITDENRQTPAGNGMYEPSKRASAAMSAGKSAGAGSSVVSLDGSSGSSPKGAKAQSEIQPNKLDSKRVDGVTNPAGTTKPGNDMKSDWSGSTDTLEPSGSINARKKQLMANKDSTPTELLTAVQADINNTHAILTEKFGEVSTFTIDFVKQKLKEASSAIDQALRNITIEAEIEDKKAKGILK